MCGIFELGQAGLLGNGSLGGSSGGFLGLGGFLAGTTSGLLGGFLSLLEHVLVVIDELDDSHLSGVTLTETGAEDTCVTTGTVGDLLGNVLEELCDDSFLFEFGEHETAVSLGVLFSACEQRLNIDAQCLSLSKRGVNTLVLNQRASHVAQHGRTVVSFAAKVVEFFIVSHCCLIYDD